MNQLIDRNLDTINGSQLVRGFEQLDQAIEEALSPIILVEGIVLLPILNVTHSRYLTHDISLTHSLEQ